MKLQALQGKKVLILGFGREGRDTFLFLRKHFPQQVFGIADKAELEQLDKKTQKLLLKDNNIKLHLGKNYLASLKQYDILIKSPGIAPFVITPFLSKGQRVTSQTELFFDACEGTIIGVTGTKGKSTTASLIHAVLHHAGLRAHLVGNIEKPALRFLETSRPDDIFVYELSSFQLTNLKRSPHIAVFLNVYSEHLDYYQGNFAKYARAKANITLHQKPTDFLVYNRKDPAVSAFAAKSRAQKLPFTPTKSTLPWIASTKPAEIVGRLFGISQKTIKEALQNFQPLPHRLEKIGAWKGITFYNDSLATIPEAAVSAIDALGPTLHTLLAGGFDRGISYEKLGKRIEKSAIKTLVLFPTTGEKILGSMQHPPAHFFAATMKEAVRLCYQHTPSGSICLLSPASSSFNMFKDYKDRGEQFKKWARTYGENS